MAKRCICADIHLLVRNSFVIFIESQRLEVYIHPNISRCIYTAIGHGYAICYVEF